jgi:undecaprenyl-diphosphatase
MMSLIIELLKSFLFGIVQGITEWIPVSSTGHLILLNTVLHLNVFDDPAVNLAFWNLYKVAIQLGSIFAVIVLYYRRLWPFSSDLGVQGRKQVIHTWLLIIIATIPVGVIGFFLNDLVDEKLSSPLVVALTLVIYGVIFLIVEAKPKRVKMHKMQEISWLSALMTGFFESLALIPGTSRSGSTIIGGMLMGMSRPLAAEFAFFLAIPAMFGASVLKLIKFMGPLNLKAILVLMAGMITAFFVSVSIIRSLIKYLKTNNLRLFGLYRIILGAIILILNFLNLIPKGMV